eukprot:6090698-Heterocapsa_arctica.AAC.1
MGDQSRGEDGDYGPYPDAGRAGQYLHPVPALGRLSMPQGGRVQVGGDMPDVQGLRRHAPD